MRIAVASDDGVSIAGHFGRCAGFLVYDIDHDDVQKLDYRTNSYGHHQQGHHVHGQDQDHTQASHSHTGFVHALADCEVVICRGMGRRAVADLMASGIKPAITPEDVSAHEAAVRYAKGILNSSDASSCCSH